MSGLQLAIEAFLPFYRHMVPRDTVDTRLPALVTEATGPEYVRPLLDQVWWQLLGTVESHSFRALIGEFHTFREGRGLPATTDGDQALQEYRAYLEHAGHSTETADRYPVLRQRLDTVTRNSLDAYADIFTALAEDRAALCDAGLLPAADLSAVELFGTGSDLHNDNRQVVGVRLADDTRIVFKPRALTTDSFVRDLCAAAEPYLDHSVRECVPLSLTIGSHGWQQFVAPRAMSGQDQPARYFYRFGALCALFGAIGATDLHDENLLAVAENPCVVDTETMIRANFGMANDSLPHTLINQLKLSVASTVLIPMVDPNAPIDLIVAGVGIDGEQNSKMRRPVVKDTATDHIRVVWENVTYRHKHNVPRLGETALSPVDHFTEILAGYTDALKAVRGDGVTKVLDSYPDMPVRCLIRSTMIYSRFLDAATHPDYLVRPQEAERIFRLLGNYPEYLTPEAAAYVGEQERAALHTGNVPYFVAPAGSTALGTPTSSFPAVYKSSPLEFARLGVELNARRSDLYHHFLLEECFGEVAGTGSSGLSSHSVFAAELSGARARGWWQGIARVIAAVGVSHEGPDGPATGWVSGIGPDRNAPTLTPGNFISFHDAGGIVTFLEKAARYDDGFREAGLGADRGLDALLAEYGEILLQIPEGVFTGAASLLLTRPHRADGGWLERVLDKIGEGGEEGSADTDLANGPAGTLMVLLSRLESGGSPLVAPERLERLSELVRTDHADAPRTAPWFDVAHGDLGMRWAAARTGRVLGDTAAVNASADWLISRCSDGEGPAVPGWCNGAAGLLLTSAEILASADRQDWLTGRRLADLVDAATRLPADGPVDLSVCHGSGGVVQSLIAAARILRDESLLDRAVGFQERVIAAARQNGFHTGVAGRTSLLGYMFGWSGVGDTDMMLDAAARGVTDLAVPVALHTPVPAGT